MTNDEVTDTQVTWHVGDPPVPVKVVENPAFARWVERCATWLCTEDGPKARPCMEHVKAARRIGRDWHDQDAVETDATKTTVHDELENGGSW